jgi:hypothetical protein
VTCKIKTRLMVVPGLESKILGPRTIVSMDPIH